MKLIGSIDFRVNGVSRRHEISHSDAQKLTMDIDKKSVILRNEFAGEKIEYVDYDLIFNCEKLTSDETVQLIVKAAELKNLFKNNFIKCKGPAKSLVMVGRNSDHFYVLNIKSGLPPQ